MAVRSFGCRGWVFSSCSAWASHCCGACALGAQDSVVAAVGPGVLAQQLWGTGLVAACGIFLRQGSNQCPLHWPVDS